jgi:hypothetical protein
VSSKRQHFIPRLLLKGFASRTKGDSTFVYLFRRGETPREVNVTNVAVARYFYGGPGEGPVDAILTGREGDYAALLDELRQKEVRPERKTLIEEFVAHLIVRTKNARDAVALLGDAALEAIERELETPGRRASLRQRAREDLLAHPEVREALAQLPRGKRQRAGKEMRKVLGRLDPREAFAQLRRELEQHDVAGGVRAAQLKALSTLGHPRASTGMLANLEWSVVDCPRRDLILGDVGPLAFFGGQVGSPLHGGSAVEAMMLPISSQCLLVGVPGGLRMPLDIEAINTASAEYSREFLVAAQNSERERGYQALICRKALDRPEWMDRAARRAFEERS